MKLTSEQRDRAAGVMLGLAAGDALGAGYEFGPPLAADTPVEMKGGGGFAWSPGEWTDDTSMAVPILDAAAAGLDLMGVPAQDRIVGEWYAWSRTATDVGIQTRHVLDQTGASGGAAEALQASEAVHEAHGRSGGNGSLMRTAPVALAYLADPEGLTRAAAALSRLTHWEDDAAEACVLWCHLIRHAVLTGEIVTEVGVDALPDEARAKWRERLEQATGADPRQFDKNGWVVHALQGAWAAITSTAGSQGASEGEQAGDHLRLALEEAVRGGRDTDTVAAIAGQLLGARWGASAVPSDWRRLLHGWPGRTGEDLVASALRIVDAQPELAG